MPYADPERKKEYNREYMKRLRELKQKEFMEKTFGITGNERIPEQPKEHGYPEYRGYAEAFKTEKPIISDKVLNPQAGYKGRADNPEPYHMVGTLVCNICGFPLDNRGKCPACEPNQVSQP